MVFNGFTNEEDTRKYREFLKSQFFRNSVRTLTSLETDMDGLTPAEIWTEVEHLINELRKTEPEDRELLVSHLHSLTRRNVQVIRRDGQEVKRTDSDVDRTETCIFYCLALILEATSRDERENPHHYLLDALVKKMMEIDHPILPQLHKGIKGDGEMFEERAGRELIKEDDPLKVADKWTETLRKVFDHYANRMYSYVKRERRHEFDALWKAFANDGMVSELMKENVPIKGDEQKELETGYNAKALFNIYGLLFRQGFFSGIRGETPLAKELTEHEDPETKNTVIAKYEYFKSDQAGIKPQFNALDRDMYEHIMKMITEES